MRRGIKKERNRRDRIDQEKSGGWDKDRERERGKEKRKGKGLRGL